jgi:hypothetical protein
MDNFDLRKFLAENKQPIQEMDAPMEVEAPMEGETMEEMVAEYVQEALGCKDMKEMAAVIEGRCNKAAMELQMETIAEVLAAYEGRLSEIKGSAYFKEMADETKVANQEGMIKGLHEMAMSIKEEYKKAYVKEEEGDGPVEEEAVKEGSTIDGSTVKIVDGPIGAEKFINAFKAQKNLPTPPPLPPSVNGAIKAYLDSDEDYSDFGKVGTKALAAGKELGKYVINNNKLAAADKGYYINQFNTMVMGKKKSKPAPPPLPAGAKKKMVPPPPPPPPKR